MSKIHEKKLSLRQRAFIEERTRKSVLWVDHIAWILQFAIPAENKWISYNCAFGCHPGFCKIQTGSNTSAAQPGSEVSDSQMLIQTQTQKLSTACEVMIELW